MAGVTAGYLFIGEPWLLAFALSGPSSMTAVLDPVVGVLSPALGVPSVAGCVAVLTAVVVGDEQLVP